jgi:hypothetical protein
MKIGGMRPPNNNTPALDECAIQQLAKEWRFRVMMMLANITLLVILLTIVAVMLYCALVNNGVCSAYLTNCKIKFGGGGGGGGPPPPPEGSVRATSNTALFSGLSMMDCTVQCPSPALHGRGVAGFWD